jgi:DNA-directed RNA polymerase delta subunit
MQQWRTQALNESMAEMQQRVGQVYQFTRDGRFVLGDEP